MINRRRFLKTSLVGGAALAVPGALSNLISAQAWSALAEPLLDFSGSFGALITYNGSGGPMTGRNINITALAGQDTPSNDGAILHFAGVLRAIAVG